MPVKANEEEDIILKEPLILMAEVILMVQVNTRILMVEESAMLAEEEEEEVETLMVAVAEVAMATVTALLVMTKLIRAIIMWCPCQGHPAIAPDLDAVYRNVSLRREHGLVYEEQLMRKGRGKYRDIKMKNI